MFNPTAETGQGGPHMKSHSVISQTILDRGARVISRFETKIIPKVRPKSIPKLSQKQINRLFKNVIKKNNGCWEWTKYRDADGYGTMRVGIRMFRAHRLSWMATHGEISPGLCVLHKCDNTSCINPDHLFVGTQKENVHDCIKKKRRAHLVGERHGRAVLTDKQVRLLREIHAEFGVRKSELARIAGITYSPMSRALNGKSWRHL